MARPKGVPRIEFGIPRVGWLPLTVSLGSIEQSECVSDVPIDTIGACVLTLERMARGLKREEVRWHLEPEEWVWVFEREGPDTMLFRSDCPGFEPIETRTSPDVLLKRVARAILAAGAERTRSWPDGAWSWTFPEVDARRLREHILGE